MNELQKMIHQLILQIRSGEQVRGALIDLKGLIKDNEGRKALAIELGGEFDDFTVLLGASDAKVRKNAALILGAMETEDILPFLFDAYEREDVLYVKPAYLQAMEGLDISGYEDVLKKHAEAIYAGNANPEKDKHLRAELGAIERLLGMKEGEGHTFTGLARRSEMILTTNRNLREVTAGQVTSGKISLLASGVRVTGASVASVLKIRTFLEILFPLPDHTVLPGDAREAGEILAGCNINGFLDGFHEGPSSYRYRIELKGSQTPQEKGKWIKTAAGTLDMKSQGKLINSPDDYEVEIRLLRKKDGTFIPLIKMSALPDTRFAYRTGDTPGSVTPVNAALMIRLAMPHLHEESAVLDPFCQDGTILIERSIALGGRSFYGLERFKDAIDTARKNTRNAGADIQYIQRDFKDFVHRHSFDELITQLPREYDAGIFLENAARLLRSGAVLVVLVHEKESFCSALSQCEEIRALEEYVVNERTGMSVHILKRI